MIIKSDFEYVAINDEVMLIPVGDNVNLFRGLLVMNDETALIIRLLQKDQNMDTLLDAFLEEYDIDRESARIELQRLLLQLDEMGILEPASLL